MALCASSFWGSEKGNVGGKLQAKEGVVARRGTETKGASQQAPRLRRGRAEQQRLDTTIRPPAARGWGPHPQLPQPIVPGSGDWTPSHDLAELGLTFSFFPTISQIINSSPTYRKGQGGDSILPAHGGAIRVKVEGSGTGDIR